MGRQTRGNLFQFRKEDVGTFCEGSHVGEKGVHVTVMEHYRGNRAGSSPSPRPRSSPPPSLHTTPPPLHKLMQSLGIEIGMISESALCKGALYQSLEIEIPGFRSKCGIVERFPGIIGDLFEGIPREVLPECLSECFESFRMIFRERLKTVLENNSEGLSRRTVFKKGFRKESCSKLSQTNSGTT